MHRGIEAQRLSIQSVMDATTQRARKALDQLTKSKDKSADKLSVEDLCDFDDKNIDQTTEASKDTGSHADSEDAASTADTEDTGSSAAKVTSPKQSMIEQSIRENHQRLKSAIALFKTGQTVESTQQFSAVLVSDPENAKPEQRVGAHYGLLEIAEHQINHAYGQCKESLTFLESYHETLLTDTLPSWEDGERFPAELANFCQHYKNFNHSTIGHKKTHRSHQQHPSHG